ncbi:MAG: hypothetical protein CMB77_05010 [Euryarchaeota archaeon]|nr:hypothetical protein [Euryarchaeota archaeon]|tara:strand:- start:485 stop:823 length:339 start_codon:yes stop_codon:yes gene_type:complete
MRSFALLIVLFLIACASEVSNKDETEFYKIEASDIDNSSLVESAVQVEKVNWVCYHPGTIFHNQPCVEEEYPDGCYVRGDQGKFCWLLHISECADPLNDDVRDSCKNVGYSD